MSHIFTKNHNLCTDNVSANTRSNSIFYNAHNPKTRNYGLNTLRHLGLKVYDMVPEVIKNSSSVQISNPKLKIGYLHSAPADFVLSLSQTLVI